jgi:hypothetical protein
MYVEIIVKNSNEDFNEFEGKINESIRSWMDENNTIKNVEFVSHSNLLFAVIKWI